jgi:hypothetical protein
MLIITLLITLLSAFPAIILRIPTIGVRVAPSPRNLPPPPQPLHTLPANMNNRIKVVLNTALVWSIGYAGYSWGTFPRAMRQKRLEDAKAAKDAKNAKNAKDAKKANNQGLVITASI